MNEMAKAQAYGIGSGYGDVGIYKRAVFGIFGSPSFLLANGLHSVFDKVSKLKARKRSSDSSTSAVYKLDRLGSKTDEKLPRIWVSQPIRDESGKIRSRRTFTASYPNGPDPRGERAMELADGLFSEGLGSTDSNRAQLFQAAEILYLHAAERGNAAANLPLGRIYQFDMCRGSYWQSELNARAKHSIKMDARETMNRAWTCFAKAAAAGLIEVNVSLGDVLSLDKGSNESCMRAVSFYDKARIYASLGIPALMNLDSASSDADIERELALLDPHMRYVYSTASLRLARCFELGVGIRRSATCARRFYCAAYCGLKLAYDHGAWHCKSDMIKARDGSARMAQDIMGIC